MMLHVGDRVLT